MQKERGTTTFHKNPLLFQPDRFYRSGNSAVKNLGVCWAFDTDFNNFKCWNSNNKLNYLNNDTIVSSVINLIPGTKYYIRAYAENDAGTAYGETISFTTKDATFYTDPRDQKTYRTVTIGNQTWMAHNMSYDTIGSLLVDPAYGRLYAWDMALKICPEGWHLPSDVEWQELEQFLGMNNVEVSDTGARGTQEAGKIKEISTAHWLSNIDSTTNETGFTARGSGMTNSINNQLLEMKESAYFWTSTNNTDSTVWIRKLTYENNAIHRTISTKYNGYCVRCIQD